MAKHKFEELLI